MDADKKKYFWIVLSICLAAFISKLDTYIVNISLPTIAKELNVTSSVVSQVVLSFIIFNTCTLLIFGKIADTTGLKKLLLWGYVIFIISSLLCGISSNIYMLIGFRCIQGISGAMLTISTFALIAKILPKEMTGWGFGLVTSAAALGVTLGAPLGGLLTGYLSWRWVFIIKVPIAIAAIAAASMLIPKDEPLVKEKSKEKFDFLGAVLSFLFILLFLYGLNMGKEHGWHSLLIISCFIASLICFISFLWIEKKHPNALLDMSIFRIEGFSFALLTACIVYIVMSGNAFIFPFYLELTKDLKPQSAGFIFMIYSIVYLLVAPFAGRLADKINPRLLCIIAVVSGLFACFVFAGTLHLSGLFYTILFISWLAVSISFFIAPNNKFIMDLAPKEKKGTVSGLYNSFTTLCLALGVCFFETIFSEVVPHGKSLSHDKVPLSILADGFKYDYLFAASLFLAAIIFSLILMVKNKDAKKI